MRQPGDISIKGLFYHKFRQKSEANRICLYVDIEI